MMLPGYGAVRASLRVLSTDSGYGATRVAADVAAYDERSRPRACEIKDYTAKSKTRSFTLSTLRTRNLGARI